MWEVVVLLVLGVFTKAGYSGGGNKWTYEGTLGPTHWSVDYPLCGGSHQSPIDIDTSRVQLDSKLSHFDMTHLTKMDNVNMTLENVMGHTVEVHIGGEEMHVMGGGLVGEYVVSQFHFHWGAKDERGSEHTVNDKHYPMEMHIVMYSNNYTDFDIALSKTHGLAVFGFFFHVGKTNEQFEKLLLHFNHIEHSEDTFPLAVPVSLISLLPERLAGYYRYYGSLTTPPCLESVIWTLFTQTIEVSEEQLEKFRHIKRTHQGEQDKYLIDDFRPIQHLNHRIVTTDIEDTISRNESDNLKSIGMVASVILVGIATMSWRMHRQTVSHN